MEFAKNVPKPKVKPQSDNLQQTTTMTDEDENQLADHLFNGGLGAASGKGVTDRNKQNHVLQMLDQRHQAYSDEVQKIKRTFGFNM